MERENECIEIRKQKRPFPKKGLIFCNPTNAMTVTDQDLSVSFFERLRAQNARYQYRLPSRNDVGKFVEEIMCFLFPITQDCGNTSMDLPEAYGRLQKRLLCLLEPLHVNLETGKMAVAEQFLAQLPAIYENLS